MAQQDIIWGNSKFYTTAEEYAAPLGAGAFGKVYKCHMRNFDDTLAVKIVSMEKTDAAYKYVLQEIELLYAIRTYDIPYVVKFYEVIKLQETSSLIEVAMVFELCPGGTLSSAISQFAPLSESKVRLLLKPLVECFAQLHMRVGLIHRDLKPENILLKKHWDGESPPELRLCDFGISTLKKAAMSRVGTGIAMAPEVFQGIEYNHLVDVFSFGLIFYHTLYGITALCQETAASWYHSGIVRIPKARKLSVECFDVLQRCLRIDSDERPSFSKLLEHPFFASSVCHPFSQLFDGSDGVLYYSLEGPAPDYVKTITKPDLHIAAVLNHKVLNQPQS